MITKERDMLTKRRKETADLGGFVQKSLDGKLILGTDTNFTLNAFVTVSNPDTL